MQGLYKHINQVVYAILFYTIMAMAVVLCAHKRTMDSSTKGSNEMKAIEYSATVLTMVGFFLISSKVFLLGFALSIVSNVLWVIWAKSSKATGIIIVNSVLFISGVNGIINVL